MVRTAITDDAAQNFVHVLMEKTPPAQAPWGLRLRIIRVHTGEKERSVQERTYDKGNSCRC